MTNPDVNETIQKYENYINDVLKEDLKVLEQQLIHMNVIITDLNRQQDTLKVVTNKEEHPEGFKTQVHLGCNFFMEATVPDTSTMLVAIGLNYFLELSLPEATKHLEKLIKAYEVKAEEIRTKAAETQAHIKFMLMGLNALVTESNKT